MIEEPQARTADTRIRGVLCAALLEEAQTLAAELLASKVPINLEGSAILMEHLTITREPDDDLVLAVALKLGAGSA